MARRGPLDRRSQPPVQVLARAVVFGRTRLPADIGAARIPATGATLGAADRARTLPRSGSAVGEAALAELGEQVVRAQPAPAELLGDRRSQLLVGEGAPARAHLAVEGSPAYSAHSIAHRSSAVQRSCSHRHARSKYFRVCRDHSRSTWVPIGSSQWKCHTPRFCSALTLATCRGRRQPGNVRCTHRSAERCAASNSCPRSRQTPRICSLKFLRVLPPCFVAEP